MLREVEIIPLQLNERNDYDEKIPLKSPSSDVVDAEAELRVPCVLAEMGLWLPQKHRSLVPHAEVIPAQRDLEVRFLKTIF